MSIRILLIGKGRFIPNPHNIDSSISSMDGVITRTPITISMMTAMMMTMMIIILDSTTTEGSNLDNDATTKDSAVTTENVHTATTNL